MTKDSPSGGSGGRASSKKPDSPVDEQQRLELELEKLRADLERERARGRAERRRFEDQARQLREAAVQERQQLEDHLRSKWEAESGRALRQLQEGMLREREAEIRRLLRWKEAELRQLQRLLHRERDDVVRQARELQRQLAEELVSRGYCGRSGVPEGAARCRCRLQEVLAQLRWDQDGEQASRIRHLQEELDMERQLFLKYILEHFQWQLSLPEAQPGQASSSSEEPPPETLGGSCSPPKSPTLLESLNSLSQSGICLHLRSPALVPKLDSNPAAGLHATRSNSLDSWMPMSFFPLEGTPSGAQVPYRSGDPASDASPSASIPWSPSPSRPPCHPGGEDIPGSLPPFEALQPSPNAQNHHRRTAQQNSELSRLLQALVQRCWGLYAENQQLRRAGLADEADKKAKRLKVEHAERHPGLPRRRLKDRARKLHDFELRTLSAPGLGERAARLVSCRVSGRQSAQDLSEQASALLAKDKQIEELRRECYLLQARVASSLDSPPLTDGDGAGARGGAAQAQWLSIKDLDRLQRESQREVLRLQKQLALQQRGTSRSRERADGQTTPGKEEEEEKEEEARSQIEALERELGACQRECADLSAQAAAARRRGEEAEAQLQAALHKGAWLARENARLQTQADPRSGEVAAQDTDRRGQLDNACQERAAAALLAQKLMQEATCDQDKQQQLQQHDLQKAPCDLQAAGGEMQHQPGNPPGEPQEAFQGKTNGTELQPGLEDTAILGSSRDRQIEKDAFQLENPFTLGEPASVPSMPNRDPDCHPPDSRSQTKKIRPLSNSSSEVEPQLISVPSGPTLDNKEDDLEPASLSSTLEMKKSEAPNLPKLKIFLARYSYNPMEGPNEHPESELPLTAGDYIYIWGDMDEDGFYKGELKDGRRGLVPSNLVEQITDGDVLGSLSSEAPDLGLTPLPTGQAKILKEDSGNSTFPGQGPGAEAREPGQLVRANAKTDMASELSGAKKTADNLDLVQEIEEQDFSRPLLRGSRSFCVCPRQLRLQSLAATSAEISWVYSSNSYPHTVYLNNKEHALIPAGVSRCTFHHLHPGTRYHVRVEVQTLWDSMHDSWEMLSSSITFTTPLAGPPDPPLDVLVEPHASPGLLVVSWLPVTINSVGSSNGVQVTGYAVYADGLKVTEVADATAGSIVLELSQLQRPLLCQKVSVRTMSLCGESLDSVPALVPQGGFLCPQTLGSSLFTYTFGDLSACRVAFSVCSQRQTQSAKSSPWTLGNCVEPQAECQEGLLEEPLRRESSRSTLGSETKNSHLESSLQAPEAMQAKKASRENEPLPKSPQNHKLLWPSDPPSEDGGPSSLMGTSTETDTGRKQPSAEGLPRKEPLQCQAALEKIHRLKEAVALFIPPRHTSLVCDIWDIWQKEAMPLGLWSSGEQEQRTCRRTQTLGCRRESSHMPWDIWQKEAMPLGLWGAEDREQRKCRRTQTLGCRREPSHMPRSAPFRKVLKRSPGRPPPLLGTGADPTARVLVTLVDHNCLMMSGDPKVEREELAIQKGQLLKAWGSQDPHGFYCGQVGNILGHLVTEVEGIPERPAIKCHLSATGRLPFVTPLDDFEILPAPQGSLPPSNPKRFPLWTPKNMMAALDYDPKDGPTRDQWKGKLSLKAGDMVTVYGPVDDNGFYYGESGCHKGLVPAYLLDHVSVQRE